MDLPPPAAPRMLAPAGVFELNNHSDWRIWRNSLPDNQLHGFM